MSFDVRYECQRCTACCRWPGWVRVEPEEISAMAQLLEQEELSFIQEYTQLRPQRDGLALVNRSNGECIFLEGRDCRVQAAKPLQCRGFPNTWNFPGWRELCQARPNLVKRQDRDLAQEASRVDEFALTEPGEPLKNSKDDLR